MSPGYFQLKYTTAFMSYIALMEFVIFCNFCLLSNVSYPSSAVPWSAVPLVISLHGHGPYITYES